MTRVGQLLEHIKEGFQSFFQKHPNVQSVIGATVDFLSQAKTIANDASVISLAGLIPNGIGTKSLEEVQTIINEGLPTLQIGQEVKADTQGITDPAALADATASSVLKHINELPPKWQGSHIEATAVAILQKILNLPLAELEMLVKAHMTGHLPEPVAAGVGE